MVWTDSRANPWAIAENDLYGARVTGTGTVLNPNGVLIADLPAVYDPNQGYIQREAIVNGARIASVGNTYLVVWEQWKNDIYCGSGHNIAGVLINTVGPTPWFYIYMDPDICGEGQVDVCTDGVDYMVAWQYSLGGTATRVITTAGVLGPIHTIPNTFAYRVASASAVGNFMIIDAYINTWGVPLVEGVRFKKDGTVLDQTPIHIGVGLGPDVASDGTNYYVAYFAGYGAVVAPWAQGDIHGKRISASIGEVLDTDLHLVSCTSRAWTRDTLDVICNGREYMVGWTDGVPLGDNEPFEYMTNDVWAGGVSLSNRPIKCFPVSITNINFASQFSLSVAHNSGSGTYFVAWRDDRNTNPDIYGVMLTHQGMPLQPLSIAICTASGTQTYPNVAELSPLNDTEGIGHGYFVTWADARSGLNHIYGARIKSDGMVYDPNGFSISTGWPGTPLVSGAQDRPCAQVIGEDILVAWQGANPSTAISTAICAARVSVHGPQSYFIPFFIHQNSAELNIVPRVATLGTNYMIVWARSLPNNYNYDIAFTRVSTNGTFLDATPKYICQAPGTDIHPKVASDPGTGRYLAAWARYVGGYKVFAGVVQEDGTVLTPVGGIQVCNTGTAQHLPAVARLSELAHEFLIAWAHSPGGDIWGARIDISSLQVLDPEGFVIDSSPGPQNTPDLAGGSDRCLAVFQSGESGTVQGMGRFVFPTPPIPSIPLITGIAFLSGLRNDWDGWAGFQFQVGGSPITVTELGRWVVSGNTESHEVKLFNADGTAVSGGSVTVSTSDQTADRFAYAPLAMPVTLSANTTYALMSHEVYGGDEWYDFGGTFITLNGAAGAPVAAYADNNPPPLQVLYELGDGQSYGPPNLKFQSP